MTATELRAELFREMNPLLDSETAMLKIITFVGGLVPSKMAKSETAAPDWASHFSGAWKDNRPAEDIISDIREARTYHLPHRRT